MRTITPEPFTVYTFSELSPEAQTKAVEAIQTTNHDLYGWGYENVDSLNAFAARAGFKVLDYSIGTCSYSYVKIDAEDEPLIDSEYLGRSKAEWNKLATECEECSLTGYDFDGAFAAPLIEALNDPSATFRDTMQSCVDAWVDAYVADIEYTYSDEAIREHIEANEYEYREDGSEV